VNTRWWFNISSDICPICGLPKDLCICGTLKLEETRIKVRKEIRRFNKPVTIIEGINEKDHDLEKIAKKLKSWLACGGTVKDGKIILMGDHKDRIVEYLEKLGFSRERIEVI